MKNIKFKKTIITLTFLLFMLVYMFNIAKHHEQNIFTSDGCSMWPDYWHYDCCYVHDEAYWKGGSPLDRLKADNELKQCISDISSPFIGEMMYYGVRVGGHPIFPVPWRWDFGRPYTGKYNKRFGDNLSEI